MKREEAIEIIRKNMPSDKSLPVYEALHSLIPELAESEDERIIRLLRELGSLDAAKELYEEFNLSYTDVLAWLEKQKEPHYNKRNELFDECVAKCDSSTMKEVSDNVDKMLDQKEQKLAEDKELLKNILFQKKGITYDDYKCKNDPYVGLSFYELIKCLEEYDKERSNR